MFRHLAAAALLAALSTSALSQVSGQRDAQGNKIPPQAIYCENAFTGRTGPCGGPGAPISITAMPGAGAGGGLTVARVNSPVGAAGMRIKATGGRLYSYNLCNNAPSSRYVRLYNTGTPVPGTTPVYAGPIVISASTCQQFSTNFGLNFSTGIGLGITAAGGDMDTTPIQDGDVTGFLGFM